MQKSFLICLLLLTVAAVFAVEFTEVVYDSETCNDDSGVTNTYDDGECLNFKTYTWKKDNEVNLTLYEDEDCMDKKNSWTLKANECKSITIDGDKFGYMLSWTNPSNRL